MSRIVEYSEDRRRGEMRHIAHAIDAVRGVPAGQVKCGRCQRGPASHLITSLQTAVCDGCAGEWKRLSPQQRFELRGSFVRGRS